MPQGKGVCDCLEVCCGGVVGVPAGTITQHGVEDHEQLAHGGGERELSNFTGSDRARW
jgi:hypothetical protein